MSDLQFAVDAATIASNNNSRLHTRVSQLERAVVLLMQDQGISMRKISQVTGISYGDVREWCGGRR